MPKRGRAERLIDLPLADRLVQSLRIDIGRTCRVHVGDDRRHSHHIVEQPEQGEAGQVASPWVNVVATTDQIDLCLECAVGVQDPFGWPGTTRGENDGGGVGWLDMRQRELARLPADLGDLR